MPCIVTRRFRILLRPLLRSTPPPDLEIISHHPQIWPGYFAYRIYGKPFISWLYQEYGWSTILALLHVHGGGLIPIEIDLKAREVFGKTFSALWRDFQRPYAQPKLSPPAILARGYWAEPFVYWNRAGVFPGKLQIKNRGRYGVVDPKGTLWLSEFNKSARSSGIPGLVVSRRLNTSGIRGPDAWPSVASLAPLPDGIPYEKRGVPSNRQHHH